MTRRFLRDSVIYFLPSALSSAMSFVLFPLFAHQFSPAEYGVLDLLTVIGWLVGATVALEIYQGVARYVAGERDQGIVRSYASTALWFTVASYGAFLIVAEALAAPVSHLLLGPRIDVILFRLAVVLMFVNGVLLISQAQLRWALRPGKYALAAVINATLTLGGSAIFVLVAHLGVKGALLGQIAGSTAATVCVIATTLDIFRLEFNLRKCRQMLAFSVPLIPGALGVVLNTYADRLVIQHERSLHDVGLYGVAYRIATIMSLLLAGFQMASTPLIFAHKDEPSTPRELARMVRLLSALSLSLFAGLSIFATPALRVLAAPEYQSAAPVVPFLVISVLFAAMYPLAPGLAIAKRTVTTAKITAVAGVANLLLALLLVPPLGVTGAGIATAMTSMGWFVALMAASQKHYPVPHRWSRPVAALIVVSALVAASMVLLSNARGEALDLRMLGLRLVIVALISALAVVMTLDRHDVRAALRATARLRRRLGDNGGEPSSAARMAVQSAGPSPPAGSDTVQ